MASRQVTFTIDEALADQAGRLGVDVAAAARDGVAAAVRRALAGGDCDAYRTSPEQVDEWWSAAEAWDGG